MFLELQETAEVWRVARVNRVEEVKVSIFSIQVKKKGETTSKNETKNSMR